MGGRPPAFRQPPPMASFGPIGPPLPPQSERPTSGPMPMDLDVIDVDAMLADGSANPVLLGSSEGGAHPAGPRQLPPPPLPPQRPLADRVRECALAPPLTQEPCSICTSASVAPTGPVSRQFKDAVGGLVCYAVRV